jgi:alkylation response protein AidB-like acyl-CoA dehydrogenase
MATSPDPLPDGTSEGGPSRRKSWPVTDPDRFRTAVRHWITANWATGITVREWWRRLADAGLTVPTWSQAFGGIDATTTVQQIIETELARIRTVAPPLGGAGVHLVGPVLRQFGTPEQQSVLLRGIVDGTSNWCVLIDEPEVVTGAPDITSTATRSPGAASGAGTWTVDAMKVTSDAHLADRGLLVVRTDPQTRGRDGITCFVIDLDQPMVSVQRVADAATVVVARGATVRDADVVGDVGGGWAVALTVFAHRRTSLAGRIRRGLVEVPSGTRAGGLDRTTGDALTYAPTRTAPAHERRRRP